jgi:hypothetical protein
MGHVEYKIESVEWKNEGGPRLNQLVEHLNDLAKDGWHVVSVDLTGHPEFEARKLPVLLEREAR